MGGRAGEEVRVYTNNRLIKTADLRGEGRRRGVGEGLAHRKVGHCRPTWASMGLGLVALVDEDVGVVLEDRLDGL